MSVCRGGLFQFDIVRGTFKNVGCESAYDFDFDVRAHHINHNLIILVSIKSLSTVEDQWGFKKNNSINFKVSKTSKNSFLFKFNSQFGQPKFFLKLGINPGYEINLATTIHPLNH